MIHVVIYDADAQVGEILAEILGGTASLDPVESLDDWDNVRRALAVHMRSVVVLGPSTTDLDLAHALEIGRAYPGTAFVSVSEKVDVALLQKAMRHGIREVVPVTDGETELAAAVERAHATTSAVLETHATARGQGSDGKVVAVFGTKGGTGKTLVATNLAVLSASAGARTALFDAGVRFGDCAAFLRLRPEKTLADLHGIAGPIDDVALSTVLTTHESGLRMLCAPNDPLEAERFDSSLVTRAIQGLRNSFEMVFVDTAPALDDYTIAVLGECDIAYLVTSLELPAVKDTKLLLSAFDRLGLDIDRVRVILSRANSKVGFPPEEVGKALGRRTVAELPSDVAVPRSINNGVPVALENPKAKVSRALAQLTDVLRVELLSQEPGGRRASLFARARARSADAPEEVSNA